MKKNTKLIGVFVLASMIVFVLVSFLLVRHRIMALEEQRHHLLCDVLRPGMSEEEVINILDQTGEFTLRRSDWPWGDVELGIKFTSPDDIKSIGGFNLGFVNNKYNGAYRRIGSDNIIGICYFDIPTPTQ
jgi:hypothetical protein